jgi:hypothetical protein
MLNVVSAPRVINRFPMATIRWLGRAAVQVDHVSFLAAAVPLFMATPTSAWASAGASLVPPPIIATGGLCLLVANDAILSSGLLGGEVIDQPPSRWWLSAGCHR